MDIGAIVTLALTGAGVLGLLIYFLTQKGKLKLPSGTKWTEVRNELRTHLVLSKNAKMDLAGETLVTRCCWINHAVRAAFKTNSLAVSSVFSKCEEIVVYIMDDETFNNSCGRKWKERTTHAAAYITLCGRKFFGEAIPMACIRDKYVPGMMKNGEPLVHELCHAYKNDYVADDQDHADPKVWTAAGGNTAAQTLARKSLTAE